MVQVMLKFYNKIHTELGKTLTHLNLGGGFGVKYKEADAAVPYEDYMSDVSEAVHAACKEYGIQVPYIYIEPGRSIVCEAGLTLYTVGDIKTIPNVRTYVAIDGGMYENPRYALYQSDYTCLIARRTRSFKSPRSAIFWRCSPPARTTTPWHQITIATRVLRSSWFAAENPVSSSKGRPMKTSCATMCDFTHCCAKIS